jgi:hypothetical protein
MQHRAFITVIPGTRIKNSKMIGTPLPIWHSHNPNGQVARQSVSLSATAPNESYWKTQPKT